MLRRDELPELSIYSKRNPRVCRALRLSPVSLGEQIREQGSDERYQGPVNVNCKCFACANRRPGDAPDPRHRSISLYLLLLLKRSNRLST